MNAIELLDDVKTRFSVLLLEDDEAALLSLLRKALFKYQEIAGFSEKVRIQAGDIDAESFDYQLPSDFLSRLVLKDKRGRFVPCDVWGDKLEFRFKGDEEFPLTLFYLKNAVCDGWESAELPLNSISLLGDYLELLITIPNSERRRLIYNAGKFDATDLPTEADLNARKTELENAMRLNRAIIPPISYT